MARLLKKVRERLSWRRVFGYFSFSCKKEMTEALKETFHDRPF